MIFLRNREDLAVLIARLKIDCPIPDPSQRPLGVYSV